MPLAIEAAPNDQRLRRYLLGLLDDGEAQALDEASIADDDVAATLQGAEDDLVDDYVRGALDAPTRARFESFYLASPLRREKVRTARRVLAAVDRVAVRASATSSTVFEREPVRRRAVFGWASAAAFATVVIASAVLFFAERPAGPPGAKSVSTVASHATPAPSADSRIDPDVTVLKPDARSGEALPVVSAEGTPRVRFDLQLEAVDFTQYAVTLRNPAGRVVWRGAPGPPQKSAAGDAVTAAVPTDVLTADRYSFALEGVRADGHRDPVATYTFRVGPH
jgi:hypothetical protein